MILTWFVTLLAIHPRHEFSEMTRALKPVTVADALVELPAGQAIRLARDFDDDGRVEVAMARWDGGLRVVDLMSTRDGSVVRRLWSRAPERPWVHPWSWDLGDVDADSVPDLILGLASEDTDVGRASGIVVLVSGATGAELRRSKGSRAHERWGGAVAFVGDVDRDGVGDYVVGACEGGPATSGGGPGFVSARSGRDDRELWREVGPTEFAAFGSRLRVLGDLDGDGILDLAAQHEHPQRYVTRVLSGADGSRLRELGPDLGRATPVGDLDADGVVDVAFEVEFDSSGGRGWNARVLSGRTWELLFEFAQPDLFPVVGVTESVGDLDGDGYDDFAVSETNHNLPQHRFGDPADGLAVFAECTFGELLDMGARPHSMIGSGCLWIVSGRTREPIWVVYAEPNSVLGLGRSVCVVPDVTGDGLSDLIVGGAKASYLFAGPGR